MMTRRTALYVIGGSLWVPSWSGRCESKDVNVEELAANLRAHFQLFKQLKISNGAPPFPFQPIVLNQNPVAFAGTFGDGVRFTASQNGRFVCALILRKQDLIAGYALTDSKGNMDNGLYNSHLVEGQGKDLQLDQGPEISDDDHIVIRTLAPSTLLGGEEYLLWCQFENSEPATVRVAVAFTSESLVESDDEDKKYLGLFGLSEKGDDCFFATAAIKGIAKSRDCPELACLRKFRDNYMRQTPIGRLHVEEYYRIAPTLIRRLIRSTDSEAFWLQTYRELVLGTCALVNRGRNHEAAVYYRAKIASAAELVGMRPGGI